MRRGPFYDLVAPYYLVVDETEPQLIGEASKGNRLAAERLAERYRKMVFCVAFEALRNADDANDVVQETLVYAFLQLPNLRDKGKFVSWLRTITLSQCADYRRRRGTRFLGEPFGLLSEASEEFNYVESLVVREALAGLSEAHRMTLLLHYQGGWSLEEVASLLQIPVNTVRSRLMSAKRRVRADVLPLIEQRKTMLTDTFHLPVHEAALLETAFPGARILLIQPETEPWMPFKPRVQVALPDGSDRTFDFRSDIDPGRVVLLDQLEREGISGPRVVHGPVANPSGGFLSLCEQPRGENLLLWALGGTPHRIRLATERAFEAIDRLQAVELVGADLPRRTLLDELEIIGSDERWNANAWLAEEGHHRAEWLSESWFVESMAKVRRAAADIRDALVYTHYGFFFPLSYRIQPGDKSFAEPFGAPGDPLNQENPLVEFVNPFGHFGDPLLGLAMVWVYDCYPFVHTGFVEQFLWRRGVSRREFAPRLAIMGLQMVARHLSTERPVESRFWDGLHGWVEQAISWM